MSQHLTAAELTALREAQADHMQDACHVGTRSTTQDGSGHPAASYSYGAELACGFRAATVTSGGLDRRAHDAPVITDVVFRLPHGTVVQAADRIKLTKRHGTAVTAVEYEVAAEPRVGATGLVVLANKVVA